jgi:hypothetical protein
VIDAAPQLRKSTWREMLAYSWCSSDWNTFFFLFPRERAPWPRGKFRQVCKFVCIDKSTPECLRIVFAAGLVYRVRVLDFGCMRPPASGLGAPLSTVANRLRRVSPLAIMGRWPCLCMLAWLVRADVKSMASVAWPERIRPAARHSAGWSLTGPDRGRVDRSLRRRPCCGGDPKAFCPLGP